MALRKSNRGLGVLRCNSEVSKDVGETYFRLQLLWRSLSPQFQARARLSVVFLGRLITEADGRGQLGQKGSRCSFSIAAGIERKCRPDKITHPKAFVLKGVDCSRLTSGTVRIRARGSAKAWASFRELARIQHPSIDWTSLKYVRNSKPEASKATSLGHHPFRVPTWTL